MAGKGQDINETGNNPWCYQRGRVWMTDHRHSILKTAYVVKIKKLKVYIGRGSGTIELSFQGAHDLLPTILQSLSFSHPSSMMFPKTMVDCWLHSWPFRLQCVLLNRHHEAHTLNMLSPCRFVLGVQWTSTVKRCRSCILPTDRNHVCWQ